MMSGKQEDGQIITFYGYKGGTGRSMAVANMAHLLANRPLADGRTSRVLVIDWDLEAPGLHRYFFPGLKSERESSWCGVIDFFEQAQVLLNNKSLFTQDGDSSYADALDHAVILKMYIQQDVAGNIDFMPAGRFDKSYGERIHKFDWSKLYDLYPELFTAFRQLLAKRYDWCLIDSRTGLSDISSICTAVLPERVVGLFTPNHQSLEGLLEVLELAVRHRQQSDDLRPLLISPLPSRVETAEQGLRAEWRNIYEKAFVSFFRRVYELEECDLRSYFDNLIIPHLSYYSYGEKIAVKEERDTSFSLRRAYESFADALVHSSGVWDYKPSSQLDYKPSVDARDFRYDVYISYSSTDRAAALAIGRRLVKYGLRPFLLEWFVKAGKDWIKLIYDGIEQSRSAIVLIGSDVLTSLQRQEIEYLLSRSINTIIPVVLPSGLRPLPPELQRRASLNLDPLQASDDGWEPLMNSLMAANDQEQASPAQRVDVLFVSIRSEDHDLFSRRFSSLGEIAHPRGTIYETGTLTPDGKSLAALMEIEGDRQDLQLEVSQAIEFFSPRIVLLLAHGIGLRKNFPGDVFFVSRLESCDSEEVAPMSYRLVQRAKSVGRNHQWYIRWKKFAQDRVKVLVGPAVAGDEIGIDSDSQASNLRVAAASQPDSIVFIPSKFMGISKAASRGDGPVIGIVGGVESTIDSILEGTDPVPAAGQAIAFAFEVAFQELGLDKGT